MTNRAYRIKHGLGVQYYRYRTEEEALERIRIAWSDLWAVPTVEVESREVVEFLPYLQVLRHYKKWRRYHDERNKVRD